MIQLLREALLTRLRFLEGVAIDSGVSASDCCCRSSSLRERSLLLEDAGILHVVYDMTGKGQRRIFS